MEPDQLPREYMVPDPYGVLEPGLHVQGNKNNCTSHTFALSMEMQVLSPYFNERTLVDVDDLWEKQIKYGTAVEERGDFIDGPYLIAETYGVRFRTNSGETGTMYLPGGKIIIKMDNKFIMSILNFFKKNKAKETAATNLLPKEAQQYKKDVESLFSETRRSLNQENPFRAELEIEQAGMGSEVYESIKDIAGVRVDFHDVAKESVELPKIDERHKDFLNSRGPIGGAGTAYWEAFEVLKHGAILSAQFLWPWVFKHVAEDFDNKVWEGVKTIVKKIIRNVSSKRTDIPIRDVVLKMHYPIGIQHGVALIFSEDLSDEEVEYAFEQLKNNELIPIEPEQPGPSVVVLRYNPAERRWEREMLTEQN